METDCDENVPLTKKKYSKPVEHDIEPEKKIELTEAEYQTLLSKPKRKMTKPKTEAQLKSFEKARLTRLNNVKKKKEAEELELARKLENHRKSNPVEHIQEEEENIPPKPKAKPKKKVTYESESSDEEVIYVKRPPKKKKKRKTIVVESSSSEESSSEEEQVSIQRNTFNPDDYFA